MGKRLADLGEEALISQLTRSWPLCRAEEVLAGVGDDCAVIKSQGNTHLLLKTDAIIENVHFTLDAKPIDIGWKALARCVSDIASMGGEPRYALVSLGCPSDTPLAVLKGLYRGIEKCAKRFQIALVGGETVSTPVLSLSITLTGQVENRFLTLRSGGKVGDLLAVTGRLGGSRRGKHLRFIPRLEEARWLVKNIHPTAMLDISDGLARDLPRLCHASKVGSICSWEALPKTSGCSLKEALSDGEDFELLFSFPPTKMDRLKNWPYPTTPITVIGKLTQNTACNLPSDAVGYDHFAKS